MTKNSETQGAQHPIVLGDERTLSRLSDESEQAYAARLAYCQLPPAKSSGSARPASPARTKTSEVPTADLFPGQRPDRSQTCNHATEQDTQPYP